MSLLQIWKEGVVLSGRGDGVPDNLLLSSQSGGCITKGAFLHSLGRTRKNVPAGLVGSLLTPLEAVCLRGPCDSPCLLLSVALESFMLLCRQF